MNVDDKVRFEGQDMVVLEVAPDGRSDLAVLRREGDEQASYRVIGDVADMKPRN